MFPLFRDVTLFKDRVNRALRLTRATVDTFVWVDVELVPFTLLDVPELCTGSVCV
tara:strand:+ start:14066 stop:14230 length:165 start_codon:yes stop_codon:yes gene_type:complete